MRLLHFDRSDRLVSTDFSGKIIPPYAILSHRWGGSEVLLEDVTSNTYKKKEGYQKIEFCAKRAAQDQLQYFWLDTCCIDKWNIRERSKAINSMFRWYKNATKCYVFLPDVSLSHEEELAQQHTWEASFRASEWFTRGWTLQELIAPESVEFFSREERRIGDKASLKQLVHEITSIPLEVLQGCPLDKFTISERMEWARNRRTTEDEDNIYCLLGILGVSMPTSYGEGKEKAQRRLQGEVDAAGSAPCIIPFSQNDFFVGREEQLAQVETRLFGDKHTPIIAIVGPGGTGKSQLALELAYRTRQKKGYSVFWVDASDIDRLSQSYASIAQKLDVPGWKDEKADIRQLVKQYLGRTDAGRWLMIFDNVEGTHVASTASYTAGAANPIDYLPQSKLGSTIFTTTNSDTATRLASPNIIEIRELAPDTARRMLQNYLNAPVLRDEHQESEVLLKELSFLPLAIVQAAAYINTRNITLHNYLSRLRKQAMEASERGSESSEDKPGEYSVKDPVAATLFISMQQVRFENPLAADYLLLVACLDRKDIALDLLEASSPQREDAIRILNGYGLITRRPAESAIEVHQLVHIALQEWLRKQEMLDQWSQRAIARLASVFPVDKHGNRSKWRRLLPHAKYALLRSFAKQDDGDRISLMWKYARTLDSDGRYNEAEELFVQVMETRKRVLGDEHPDTLTSMSNLALTYRNQGRWKEAEALQVKELGICSRLLGDEHPDTLTSMNNLALTYRNQGRWKEAEALGVQVVETRKRVLGDEHPGTLTSMNNLAHTLKRQGLTDKAISLMEDCCKRRVAVLGPQHHHTISSSKTLAAWRLEAVKLSEKNDS